MATFGNTNVEANDDGPGTSDRSWGTKFTLSEAGDVTSISAYIKANSGTVNVKAGIFSDNGGVPDALQGQSSAKNIDTTYAWEDFTVSISLSAGVYWLCILVDGTTNIKRGAGGTDQTMLAVDDYADGFDDPCPTPAWYQDWTSSIYATYTPAAAGIASKRLLVGVGI